jgi:hypothetical protein
VLCSSIETTKQSIESRRATSRTMAAFDILFQKLSEPNLNFRYQQVKGLKKQGQFCNISIKSWYIDSALVLFDSLHIST